jgi:uncharacterized membrane protein YccC
LLPGGGVKRPEWRMTLSTKAKEAIKTALAMTIGYGISLSMGWDKPMWVGFAVAFVSLATVGQSLNKAALRMMGTLLGMIVSLVIIGLFAQDRWLFVLFLSLWIALCTYMMGGARHQYFWHVAGFVCAIICMDGGANSENAFQIAMLRAQQTGLGILVYGLVSSLLWPNDSGKDFNDSVSELALTQHQLYRACLAVMLGAGDSTKTEALQAKLFQQKTRFGQLLDAAEADTFEVWELRREWRAFQLQVEKLAAGMASWLDGVSGGQPLDFEHLLPRLKSFGDEIDQRMSTIESMLKGQMPARVATAIKLEPDDDQLRSLTAFQKAELAVSRRQFQQIEDLSRALFVTVRNLRGFDRTGSRPRAVPVSNTGFIPDPDRLVSGVRVMATLWLAFLAIVYVQDWPGGGSFLAMATPIGMALAGKPQVSFMTLFVPAAVGVLIASVAYIFIMPLLSSFAGLGLLIFAITFLICYRYAEPKQGLGRAFGLAMFVAIASISNEQSYSFLVVANTALMLPLVFMIVAITAHIPFSPRPERIFLRLMARFFRSCDYLLFYRGQESDKQMAGVNHWKTAFHARELSGLPQKMAGLIPQINPKALPGTSPAQLQAIVASLHSVADRMQGLVETNRYTRSMHLPKELRPGVSDWQMAVQNTLSSLSDDPTSGNKDAFQSRLSGIMAVLERSIQLELDRGGRGRISAHDGENFYRLLGGWRNVSEALITYAGSTTSVDWAPWREENFT